MPESRKNKRRALVAAVVALCAAGGGLGVAQVAGAIEGEHHADRPALTVTDGWHGDNRAALQRMIDDYGPDGDKRAKLKGNKPLAVFDWDNTVVKNDIGDATMFWLLRHDKLRTPEDGDWRTTSRYLTAAAAKALAAACPAGRTTLPTSSDTGCADEIRTVYSDGETTAGDAAFAGFDHRRMEPQYAWLAQLQQGWTEAQIEEFAAAARKENLDAAVGAEQRVGSAKVTGWVRYYEQMQDLVSTLKQADFDVWITSASPQPVLDAWVRGAGIDPERAIGIRNVHEGDVITPRLRGCGTVDDGDDAMVTYMDGKRCWINQEILGVEGAAAEKVQPARHRQVFAAGDSDTDIAFLRDATALRLVLNRNKNEVMCRAYDDSDGRWLINPMFIEPNKQQTKSYPCATTGYTEPDGSEAPVRREDGSVIADQEDTVF
ncbi:haloacid dehalogenase-like hydrolase [Streptomyces monticola]|uniref:phosphoserine phosphatase n=1 Tax=Streptomyces monticola TaxID=2666263 RepID=A0ABW2JYW7_9ACTN